MTEQDDPRFVVVERLTNAIHQLLAGNPPEVQGSVLADLLATYLAGHVDLDKGAPSKPMIEALLKVHIATVRQLVPVNFAQHVVGKLKEGRDV